MNFRYPKPTNWWELTRLVAGFRPRDQGFDATVVQVGFMADKVAAEHGCLSRTVASPTTHKSVIQRTDCGAHYRSQPHATKGQQNKKARKSGVKEMGGEMRIPRGRIVRWGFM